ncbi:hypothetical protein J45TS6_00910 [Paenibacillus sp. J45TS6]|nr:hypothetical protein J45TS6_00910 [Paenibacillus sp. J45TS6]
MNTQKNLLVVTKKVPKVKKESLNDRPFCLGPLRLRAESNKPIK